MQNPKHKALTAIIAGTLSLCICWFFWYPVFGIFISFLSIILAIIAIVYGRKIIKTYKKDPSEPKPEYYRNGKMGYYLGIIGLLISLLCFVLSLLFTLYFKFLV